MTPQLSIVIPARNEAGNVFSLLQAIDNALTGKIAHEIIYVDDGSTDATLTQLREARAAGSGNLRIIRHAQGVGQSAALHTGVVAARAAWIATLDADGQNDPADIPLLWERMQSMPEARPDLVAGIRVSRHDPFLRRASSVIANTIRAMLLRDHVSDTGCGLKLFTREAFLDLPFFDHMHRFLPALMQARRRCVICVPVSHRPRLHGESKYGIGNRLWVGIADLFGVFWLTHRLPQVTAMEDAP